MAHLVIDEDGVLKSKWVPGTVEEVKSFYRTKLGETVVDIFSNAYLADRKILMLKSERFQKKETWTCEKCGKTWKKPQFHSREIQQMFDDIKVCSACISLQMEANLKKSK